MVENLGGGGFFFMLHRRVNLDLNAKDRFVILKVHL